MASQPERHREGDRPASRQALDTANGSPDPLERIRLMAPHLSPSLRRVAAEIARDPAGAAYLSGPNLAKRAEVSQPTVVRFAQALGYDGYPAFLEALRISIRRRTTLQNLPSAHGGDALPVWRVVLETDIDNLSRTLAEMDGEAFQKAVSLLARARRVYVWGIRTTSTLSSYLTVSLSYLFGEERVMQLSPALYGEQLLTATKEDVAVVASFPRYVKLSLAVAAHVRSRGVPLVVLTDSVASPLASNADSVLYAHSEMMSFTESFVAPLSLAQALLAGVALTNREQTLAQLQRLEDLWEESGMYHADVRQRTQSLLP